MVLQRLGQHTFEGLVVGVVLKQRQPGHGAVQHVVDQPSGSDARAARHAGQNTAISSACQTKSCVPFSAPDITDPGIPEALASVPWVEPAGRPSIWTDPVEWAFGPEGAVFNAAADPVSNWLGTEVAYPVITNFVDNDDLAAATDWTLVAGTTAFSAAVTVTVCYILPWVYGLFDPGAPEELRLFEPDPNGADVPDALPPPPGFPRIFP